MPYKVMGILKHNGVYHHPGDIIDIDPKETNRLFDLGVISHPSTNEIEEMAESAELIENPEDKTDRNYEKWEDYNDIKKEAKDRGLKPESNSKVHLIEALKADDIEFDSLVSKLEEKGIRLPEEATTQELRELLEQSEVSDND